MLDPSSSKICLMSEASVVCMHPENGVSKNNIVSMPENVMEYLFCATYLKKL